MDNPCCCDFIYQLSLVGIHHRSNFLDLEYSSDCSWPTGMLIIFQAVSPVCKCLCQLNNTMDQGFFAICLLDHLKGITSQFANFFQNFMFSCYSNCNILNFHFLQATIIHNSYFLSVHCMHATAACWDKKKTDTAYGCMYPLYCSHCMKLLTVLYIIILHISTHYLQAELKYKTIQYNTIHFFHSS